MKPTGKYYISAFLILISTLTAFSSLAQVFGATTSSETFPAAATSQKVKIQPQAQKPVQFKPVGEKNVPFNENDIKPTIELYLDHLEILPTFSKITHCSATFHVRSTLNTPISNISFRLKWPNMETPISFDNVPAQGTSSTSYTLLGNGCYEMDTVPTVIVNRCRVKGLAQEACTNLIKWVK